MIMTLRTLDYEGLKASLPEDARLLIWSCNTCARMCGGLGGKCSTESLANMLESDGRTVIGREVLTASCFLSAVRKRLERPEFREMVERATHVIPLTCSTGAALLLKEMPHLQMIDVGRTIGLGYLSESRGPVLTSSLLDELIVPGDGMPLNEVAEALGLHLGPF
jgi:hypothetical protein